MALQSPLFPNEPGGALTTLLRDGAAALSQAINNSITLGRDRATTQLNQENTLFRVLDNQRLMDFRKARALREDFTTDRLFNRSVARDTRQDFVTDRGFFAAQANADRAFEESQYQFDTNKALAEKRIGVAEQAAKDRLAVDASKNELDAIKTNLELRNLEKTTQLKDDLFETTRALRDKAVSDTTADALSSGNARTVATPELANYVDLFSGLGTPDVQGNVSAAKRELATRQPDIDPATGKRIPDRFAPDKSDPFEGITDPVEQLAVAQDINQEIKDNEKAIQNPDLSKKFKENAKKRIDALKDKLRKAPVGVQKAVGVKPDPEDMEVRKLFTKPLP